MFASNCGSTCSAFNEIRHEADWYGNNLLPLENTARKVASVIESKSISSTEGQTSLYNILEQSDVSDTIESVLTAVSDSNVPQLNNNYWQQGSNTHDVGFSYMNGLGIGDTFYLRDGNAGRRSVTVSETNTSSSCLLDSIDKVTLKSDAVHTITSSAILVANTVTTTAAIIPQPIVQCSTASSGGSLVEIKVEVDPNLYMNWETSVDGESWSDSRSKCRGVSNKPCVQQENSDISSPETGSNNNVVLNDKTTSKLKCKDTTVDTNPKDVQQTVCFKELQVPSVEDEEEDKSEEEYCSDVSTETEGSGSGLEHRDGKSAVDNNDVESNNINVLSPGCTLTRSDNSVLNVEEMQISQFYKFECTKCKDKTEFPSYQFLVDHCQSKHQSDSYVRCCGRSMWRRDQLVKHMLEHKHAYRCGECCKAFSSKTAWKTHLKQHLPKPDAGPFSCPHCSKQFSSKYGLANHLNLHLPEGERPYRCRHCNKGFGAKHAMTKHERTHLPDEERLSYVCDVCGKRFGYASTLDGHQRHVHQKERPFVCHVCAKTFPIKGALTYHLTTHEEQDRVQCVECGIWLKNDKILRIHRKCHQGELYTCPHCDKVSSTRNNLRMHMKRHSDARPHACPQCIRAFKTPRDLKTHMVQHTGQKPYSCPYCPKTFASPSNFYAHRKMKHKMAPTPYEGPHTSDSHFQY